MDLNNYLAGALLDHINNQTIWTPPVTLYLAMLKTASAPTDTTAANAAKEVETPGANGYARQAITFGAHASRIASNTNVITFGPATAAWAQIIDGWIVNAATGGDILWQGDLAVAKTVGNTDSFVFAAGKVKVTLA